MILLRYYCATYCNSYITRLFLIIKKIIIHELYRFEINIILELVLFDKFQRNNVSNKK